MNFINIMRAWWFLKIQCLSKLPWHKCSLPGRNLYFLLLSQQKCVLWQRVCVGKWWHIGYTPIIPHLCYWIALFILKLIISTDLYRDIIRGSPDVKWESIKGLENAKRLLKEAVVMPIKYPKSVIEIECFILCNIFIYLSFYCLKLD